MNIMQIITMALLYHMRMEKKSQKQIYMKIQNVQLQRALIGVAVTAGSINMNTSDTSRSRRNIKEPREVLALTEE